MHCCEIVQKVCIKGLYYKEPSGDFNLKKG